MQEVGSSECAMNQHIQVKTPVVMREKLAIIICRIIKKFKK